MKPYTYYKIIATVFFVGLTLLFLDFTGTIHAYLGWMASVQFLPALLSKSFVILTGLVVLTVLFGRFYCSTICPLGYCQDITIGLVSLKNKNRFSYKPQNIYQVMFRTAIVVLFFIPLALFSFSFFASLLDPYSAFGRVICFLGSPIYLYGNNLLAMLSERMGNYAFYSVDIWLKSGVGLLTAILTVIVVSVFAAKAGRGYCNWICPVGTILGIISKYAIFQLKIDTEKCTKCGICEKRCKSECLDATKLTIDQQHCMRCYTCIKVCPSGAINVMNKIGKKPDVAENKLSTDEKTRRGVISGLIFLIVSLFTKKVHAYDYDGGLAPLKPKQKPVRINPIIPAGAESIANFRRNCTGCQLCVTVCKNNVLRPSSKLSEFMQPHMSFERGYCRPECVKCSEVCPTSAITPITPAEKSATQIGFAVWLPDNCVVLTDRVNCDLCAVKCPTGAITRIDYPDIPNAKIPMIDDNRCIGCGACEQLCPARPHSAIYVEGVDTHRTI